LVFKGPVHGPAKSLVEALDQLFAGLGDEVSEPVGFNQQPEFLDGIEIGRIGGQIEDFEGSPSETFGLMPGGIVDDENLSGSREVEVFIGVVEKSLENLSVRVGELQHVGLARAGTNHASDVHPDVVSVFRDSGFFSSLSPASPRPGIGFKAGFIGKPNFHLLLVEQVFQVLTEGLALGFILAIRPGLGDFEAVVLIMKKTNHGAITDFDLQFAPEVAVELHAGPMGLTRLVGAIQQISTPGMFRRRDLGRSPTGWLVNEAIDPLAVESFDPSPDARRVNSKEFCHRLALETHQQRNDGSITIMSLLSRSDLSRQLQFCQRNILRIRCDLLPGHEKK